MKKLLTAALLAVASTTFMALPANAGCCFGLFYRHCGCCGCGATFCVRQYNAFSPVCSGTVFCDGCCPFGSGGGGYGGYGPGFMGGCGPCAGGMCPGVMNYSGVLSCPQGGACADGSCLGSLPATDPGAPVADAPATAGSPSSGANPVVTPSPLPNYVPGSPTSQVSNKQVIQNTAYRPTVVPAARPITPVRMQPQMMAAPSYWGN